MTSKMLVEAKAVPYLIEKQWQENKFIWQEICHHLKRKKIAYAMTIARGSSDHAATFAKYLLEVFLKLPTVSAAPSVCTLYEAKLQLQNALVIAISQSGASPDLCATLKMARENGAITIAMVNVLDAPLAEIAEYVVPLHAGEELAVAATKSYLTTLAALLQFISFFSEDAELLKALPDLTPRLQLAQNMNWQPALETFQKANSTYVVGRGFGFPIAQEAALKFKETCQIHAEAFSGAEVLHGPFALVKPSFPILMFTQRDASLKGILSLAEKIKSIGAHLFLTLSDNKEKISHQTILPLPPSLHPLCDPLLNIQKFYIWIAELAALRGLNPDEPPHLNKVTKTQ